MKNISIYHNPQCGTSRTTLAMIREAGIEPEVIEYLKTPIGKEKLTHLLTAMQLSARDVLRTKQDIYQQLHLDDEKWTNDDLINFIVAHPILMNRPIVETERGVRLCRPAELVLEILPNM